jgi:hypothetical protein
MTIPDTVDPGLTDRSGDDMSIVLQVVGWIVIGIGVVFAVPAVDQIQATGLSLRNPLLVTTIGTAASLLVTGVIIIGFGSALRLLRQIRENTDRLA